MIWRSKSSVVREDKPAKGKEATAEATEAEIYANGARAYGDMQPYLCDVVRRDCFFALR
jgi:hypothetical protein